MLNAMCEGNINYQECCCIQECQSVSPCVNQKSVFGLTQGGSFNFNDCIQALFNGNVWHISPTGRFKVLHMGRVLVTVELRYSYELEWCVQASGAM